MRTSRRARNTAKPRAISGAALSLQESEHPRPFTSFHRRECVQGGFAIGSGIICDRYVGRADWRIMGPGLGALGGGVFVIIHSAQTRQRKAERLRELEGIRQQHGWTVTLNPSKVQLAYHW